MNPKIYKGFTLLVFVLSLLTASDVTLGQSSTSFCRETVIPSEIQKLVKSKYPGWRIKTVEDMEPSHQVIWMQNRFLECPGIAKGTFQGNTIQGFGLLLIKNLPEAKGFKLIVISLSGKKGQPQLTLLRDEKSQDSERFVIYQAPKGTYSDSNNQEQIEIQNDGIFLEDLEFGSTVYFWRNNRFEKLVVVR